MSSERPPQQPPIPENFTEVVWLFGMIWEAFKNVSSLETAINDHPEDNQYLGYQTLLDKAVSRAEIDLWLRVRPSPEALLSELLSVHLVISRTDFSANVSIILNDYRWPGFNEQSSNVENHEYWDFSFNAKKRAGYCFISQNTRI